MNRQYKDKDGIIFVAETPNGVFVIVQPDEAGLWHYAITRYTFNNREKAQKFLDSYAQLYGLQEIEESKAEKIHKQTEDDIKEGQRNLRWCSYASNLTAVIAQIIYDLNNKSLSLCDEERIRLENLLDLLKAVQRNILCNVPPVLKTVDALRNNEIRNTAS